LAVRRPGDSVYRLGVLIDTASYYEQSDVLERDVMRPRLLRNFGWSVCQVFAKDWYLERERVVERLLRLLAGEKEAELDAATQGAVEQEGSTATSSNGDGNASEKEIPTNDVMRATEASSAGGDLSLNGLTASDSPIATAPLPSTERSTTYLEFSDGSSHKFWEITLCGSSHSVRFGRIGMNGQLMTKSFSTLQQAKANCDRLIRQKVAKGYRKRGESAG
jgi:predicted DNA-binding WGR domain protein